MAEWTAALKGETHDCYHFPEYARLCASHEHGEAVAFLIEEQGRRLFVPLILRPIESSEGDLKGTCDAVSPYGYANPILLGKDSLVDDAFVAKAIERFVAELRECKVASAFIRLHPIISMPLQACEKVGALVRNGDTVLVDLNLSVEELWRQTRSRYRTYINKAKRSGYSISMDLEWSSADEFWTMYVETMRRVSADNYYLFFADYLDRLRRALGDALHLCIVKIDGEIACGGLFTEVCGIIQYHLSATKDEFVQRYPTKLLLDYIRAWGKERGNRWFNLGGGVGAKRDSLFEFKAGFSHLRAPFYTWRIIVDDSAYHELVRDWEKQSGLTSEGPAGFFPEYRKPIRPSSEELRLI